MLFLNGLRGQGLVETSSRPNRLCCNRWLICSRLYR